MERLLYLWIYIYPIMSRYSIKKWAVFSENMPKHIIHIIHVTHIILCIHIIKCLYLNLCIHIIK